MAVLGRDRMVACQGGKGGVGSGEGTVGMDRKNGKAGFAGRMDAGGVVATPGSWLGPLDQRPCLLPKQTVKRVKEEVWSRHVC